VERTYSLGGADDDWNPSHYTWRPADFSDAIFRARVRAIDPSGSGCDSSAVVHLDWLRLNIYYTLPSTPAEAALNAADIAKRGPDGIAGTADDTSLFTIYFGSGNPGLLAQLATGDVPVSGHEPGSLNDGGGALNSSSTAAAGKTLAPNQWTNPSAAFRSDNIYTTNNTNGNQQGFGNFAFNIPSAVSITGIEVDVEAKSPDTSGCQIGAALSVDGGSTYPIALGTADLNSTSDRTYVFGGIGSLWGRSWALSELATTTFAVRLQNIKGSHCASSATLSVDQVSAKVYYGGENGDKDNFFISPASSDMEGIFHFIGQQVCPASLNLEAVSPPTTGTLIVVRQMVNDNGGSKFLDSFPVAVHAANPSIPQITGGAGILSDSTTIIVGPGAYSLTEASVSGYNEFIGATCSSTEPCMPDGTGGICAGETRVCVITNDDIPPPPPPPNLNLEINSWHEIPTSN
jgi:hypothetical protein